MIMKKKLFFAVVAIGLLASCAENEYVGEVTPNPNPGTDGTNAIVFNSGAKTVTRSGEITGAAAANLLNKNFVVEGIKTVADGQTTKVVEVFDNYNVNWVDNSANTTASNTANWEYVGQTILGDNKTAIYEQTIKYWDYAASQYDFWAYSLGGGSATVSTLDHNAPLTSQAYTFSGNASDLAKVYISDLVTAYSPSDNVTDRPTYNQEVDLTFRALVAKIRVGLYETIPGYSVKEVKFYPSANGTAGTDAILYATGDNLPSSGTCIVYFKTIGKTNAATTPTPNPDYNKAHISFATSGLTKTANQNYGTLSYGQGEDQKHEENNSSDIWLARSSAQPTWAVETGKTPGDYSIVLPNENGEVLTLKVDYTLHSIDGSKEEITVHGATALIPAQYTRWQSNFAYTYIFKISDNTNGLTNTAITNAEGLHPITLDAIVIESETNTQETITTVATPSITTYSITSNVTTNNEYTTSDDIYITAMKAEGLQTLTNKATLYKITKNNAAYAATEAEVLETLTKYTSKSETSYVGRNGITLTKADVLDLTVEAIPLIDGNTVPVDKGKAAFIDHTTANLSTSSYYAFVYEDTAPQAPTTKQEYGIVPAADITVGTTNVSSYYIFDVATSTYVHPTGNAAVAQANTTYYQLHEEYSIADGGVYGIKVIKIQ